jgi:Domain of unknown function (DUF5666)
MRRTGISLAALAGGLAIGTGAAIGATPVQGSVVGPVTAVEGKTFRLTTPANLPNPVPGNHSTVTVASSTVITEQKAATRKSVKKGLCASALGTRNSKGVVAAQRITLTKPVKGACDTGFGRRGRRPGGSGTPPSGGPQPPGGSGGGGGFNGSGNFGFAFGTITAVKGSTLQVKGARGTTTTTTTVTLSAKTQVAQTLRVGASAIRVELCAFVRGTSTDKGVTVKAQSISLTQPTANGCTAGFRRR